MSPAHRDTRVYLQDILAAIERVEEYRSGGSKAFRTNHLVQDAIIRQLSIIGEAATKLPKSMRDRAPGIPWRQIIGLRNIIVHDYSEINLGRIWDTVVADLPALKLAVRGVLDSKAA